MPISFSDSAVRWVYPVRLSKHASGARFAQSCAIKPLIAQLVKLWSD